MKLYSLRQRITGMLLIAIILQMAILCVLVFSTGLISRLDESTIQVFRDTERDRSLRVEEYLRQWSNVSEYYSNISERLSALADEENISISEYVSDDERRQEFLAEALDEVIACQDFVESSYAFLIMENDNPYKDAIWLSDLSPQDHSEDNRDLLAITGLPGHFQDRKIALHSQWAARVPVFDYDKYYYMPYNGGNDSTHLKGVDLGCYTGMNTYAESDREFIAYSLPILDENHRSVGVFGVGATVEYISRIFPDGYLDIDNDGSFYIGRTNDGGKTVRTIITLGGSLAGLLKPGDDILMEYDERGIARVAGDEPTLVDYDLSLSNLNLYKSNTPYVEYQWVAGSFVHSNALHSSSRQTFIALGLIIFVTFAVGMLFAILISRIVTRPLKKITGSLEQIALHDVDLPQTGTREIDQLTEVISRRNKEVFEAASKLETVIELAGAPVGVIEYKEGSDIAMVTKKAMQILNIREIKSWNSNYISAEDYLSNVKTVFDRLIPEDGEEMVYSLAVRGERRYIQIRNSTDRDSNVHVLIDVTDTMRDKIRMRHERDFDVLTNIFNRRAFEREVNKLFFEGKIKTAIMSVWDLDDLKYVNDTYGHDAGDDYIRTLPDIFRQVFHQANSLVARRSGDEFFAFLYNAPVPEMQELMRKAHELFCTVEKHIAGQSYVSRSVSAGMAVYSEGDEYIILERRADFAMYDAKRAAKGSLRLFDPEIYERDQILINGVAELNRILKEEDIRYRFQPIFDPKSNEIFGYEALMEPVSDIVQNATELLRLAQIQTKLHEIERITWVHSMREFLRSGRDEGGKYHLFIKTLPNQCLTDGEFAAVEHEFGDRLSLLSIETVENARIDAEMEDRKRKWCKKWGVSLTLDDYGSGFSNNDILVSRNYDFVKISLGLVQTMDTNPNTKSLIRGIIDFCHNNGQKVIAEGVETTLQRDALVELGVDLLQGFLFAKPE